jgi:hypothetical protein
MGWSADYRRAMNLRANSCRAFTTKQGYLGLGPLTCEEDDHIFILVGANVPFILRKGEEHRFQLVGEAYIHDIMDGELMQGNAAIQEVEVY